MGGESIVKDMVWKCADWVFDNVIPVIALMTLVPLFIAVLLLARLWYRVTGRDPDDVLPAPNWGSW